MLTQKRPALRSHSDRATLTFTSKHLDLVLLACCSCLLALMCQPALNLLPGSSAASSTIAASPAASSQTNFYVKSALLSAYQDKGRKTEASLDR